MDIITHAIVGGVIGAQFGHPIVGVVVGALPDVTLGIKRRQFPTTLYRLSHSFITIFFTLALLVYASSELWWTVGLAWISHIVLDIPTHGTRWSPRLLYPLNNSPSMVFAKEWEWFNSSWWIGLKLGIVICALSLLIGYLL